MARVFKKIITPFFQIFVRHYFKKPRTWRYNDLKITVNPGVFFPHFTLSTKHLLQFFESRDLTRKKVLELGCGAGAISVRAAQKGAHVLASDVNPDAIKNCQQNGKRNSVSVKSIVSDLFSDIPKQEFDLIIINPPYYPKNPTNDSEKAWYCGENFEYFSQLFSQLGAYIGPQSKVYMILSEDCEIQKIKEIAAKFRFVFALIIEKRKWGELNYIFQISQNKKG